MWQRKTNPNPMCVARTEDFVANGSRNKRNEAASDLLVPCASTRSLGES